MTKLLYNALRRGKIMLDWSVVDGYIRQIYQALRTGRDDVDESRDTTEKSW